MIQLGGDPRWIAWDTNSEIAATQYDQIVSFMAGDQFTESDRYPRPGRRDKPAEQAGELFAPTIADFNVGAFMSRVNADH